jgi:hypothetical protein
LGNFIPRDASSEPLDAFLAIAKACPKVIYGAVFIP